MAGIVEECRIGPPVEPVFKTHQQLVAALAECPPDGWRDKAAALDKNFARARAAAAQRLSPAAKVVQVVLPGASIGTEAELDAWLATVRSTINGRLQAGER